jgi:hypothetical protein
MIGNGGVEGGKAGNPQKQAFIATKERLDYEGKPFSGLK